MFLAVRACLIAWSAALHACSRLVIQLPFHAAHPDPLVVSSCSQLLNLFDHKHTISGWAMAAFRALFPLCCEPNTFDTTKLDTIDVRIPSQSSSSILG